MPRTAASRSERPRRALGVLLALATTLPLAGCGGSGGPGAGGIAEAGGCRIERAAELPVTVAHNHLLVPARINRTDVTMLVDTGAERTMLTETASRSLALARARRGGRALLLGTGGTAVGSTVFASVELGGAEVQDMRLPVGHLPGHEDQVAGLIGTDLLADFDLEIDVPARRLTLWRVHGCVGPYLPWRDRSFALVARRSSRGRLFVPVEVEGRTLSAVFDTGAARTVLTTEAAMRAGVAEADLARDPGATTRGVDETATPTHRHRFSEVRIGPERFRGLPLDVAGLTLREGDMLLGADYVQRRRVWLSFDTGRIFVRLPPRIPAPAPGTAEPGQPGAT